MQFQARDQRGLRNPACVNDGPIARTIAFFGCVPVTMNPPINALSPVPTLSRVEILASWEARGSLTMTIACAVKPRNVANRGCPRAFALT